jgi:hypothetical protein
VLTKAVIPAFLQTGQFTCLRRIYWLSIEERPVTGKPPLSGRLFV